MSSTLNKKNQKKLNQLLAKIKNLQKQGKFDLSSDEDLSIGIMNLISIEEHLFFTAVKTGKFSYLELLNQVRQMRKKLLKQLIKDYEGEVWCISKHLLAASMRLYEVGTKQLNLGKKRLAWEFFQMAYNLYSLFWGLIFGVVKKDRLEAKKLAKNEFFDPAPIAKQQNSPLFTRLGEIVKKALDCCRE